MSGRKLPRLPWLPRSSAREEVDDELRFHKEAAAAELIARGVAAGGAGAEAGRRLGAVGAIRDEVVTIDERRRRRAAGRDLMRAFFSDLRLGFRSLRRTPMLTVAGSLTLMLGVGATTAIFSIFNGVLLRPLPYPSVERLVSLGDVDAQSSDPSPLSFPEYADWTREGGEAFSEIGTWSQTTLTLIGPDQPVELRGFRMSASMTRMLGIRPLLGRTLQTADDSTTSPRVIMLSERRWRRRFNGDSSIVGRALTLSEI